MVLWRLKSNPRMNKMISDGMGMNKMILVQLCEDGTRMTDTNCYEQTQEVISIFCHMKGCLGLSEL